jgi:hypothetical protein
VALSLYKRPEFGGHHAHQPFGGIQDMMVLVHFRLSGGHRKYFRYLTLPLLYPGSIKAGPPM